MSLMLKLSTRSRLEIAPQVPFLCCSFFLSFLLADGFARLGCAALAQGCLCIFHSRFSYSEMSVGTHELLDSAKTRKMKTNPLVRPALWPAAPFARVSNAFLL